MRAFLVSSAAALALLSVPAHAEGKNVVIIEGVTYAAQLDAAQSDWSGSTDMGSVSMMFRNSDKDLNAVFASLSVGFGFFGTEINAPEARLMRLPESGLERLFSDEGADKGDLAVEVLSLTVEGTSLMVEGTITGHFGPSENFGRDIRLDDPISVEASFTVQLEGL